MLRGITPGWIIRGACLYLLYYVVLWSTNSTRVISITVPSQRSAMAAALQHPQVQGTFHFSVSSDCWSGNNMQRDIWLTGSR
jgi:hypothetical protein